MSSRTSSSRSSARPVSPDRFRGNKSFLPSKPCAACGRTMSWRRAWARCWDEVKFCSEACRRGGPRR
ncbi:DUF2256 domain-containing protein [Sphaerotilus uruguayifluvii]|uniref:DUF2256 domain-containing protein n=1 Tax=Sphaerotilus uruguayifluvii TaxID=2735897 RepID=A0ABX2FZU2_9BURK|nr:DUF2256 domain-containing protein [Leptothrix sp. C29]NRT55319.1 hypothetical protein [Leptothrix sp. C29]